MRSLRLLLPVAAVALTTFGAGTAQAAITITRAELSGSQLRVEGTGAVANHAVTVNPGAVPGTADGKGLFKVAKSGYSSSTCQVTVTDGTTTSAAARLAGCSSSTPAPPPPPPAPASAPAVTLTPASLTYGARDTGTTSPAQTVTVANTGNAPLFINSARTASLDFTQVDDQCSGVTIAAGGTCTMAIVFHPILAGTRSAAFVLTDNAPTSPQRVTLTGTGTTPAGTTAPVLAFDNQFERCSGSVCAIAPDSSLLVNNFVTWSFRGKGGTEPYTFSGSPPAGLTLRPSGLLFGTRTTTGTATFPITVTDGAGSKVTQTYSITTGPVPAPAPNGCQTGGTVREPLSGAAIGGRTPSGQASADESQFSGCGGFTKLTVSVKDVGLPDGTRLWVTLDFGAVGTITLRSGTGTMATFVLQHGLSFDHVAIYDQIPDTGAAKQILSGGFFS